MPQDEISADAVRAARDIRVLVGRLRRRLKEVSDTHDLTPSQTSVLSRLSQRGSATASALAAAEGVRPQSMATILTALDERSLVTRSPDPTDGRRHLISLSDEARGLLEGGRAEREEWLARALQDRYTPAERRAITEALTLLDRLTH